MRIQATWTKPKENRPEWFQNRCFKKSGYESREALRKFNKANMLAKV